MDLLASHRIKLEAHQSNFSKYPVGCLVNFKFDSASNQRQQTQISGSTFIGSVRVGRVESVFMDLGLKSFTYEVIPSRNPCTVELLQESELYYGAGCPVNVKCATNDEEEKVNEGLVIGCNFGACTEVNKSYTVMVYPRNREEDQMIFSDVMGDVISYRPVFEENDKEGPVTGTGTDLTGEVKNKSDGLLNGTNLSSTPITCPVTTSLTSSRPALTSGVVSKLPETTPKHSIRDELASAVTVAASTQKRTASPTISSLTQDNVDINTTPSKVQRRNDPQPEDMPASISTPSRFLDPINSSHLDSIIVTIPQWLQSKKHVQLDLFFHIIGKDYRGCGHKTKSISFATNCKITLNGPNCGIWAPVMHVEIKSEPGQSNQSGLMKAKKLIIDSICQFIGEDGSKGRLYYDLAAASEQYRCHGSKSNAVYSHNPFLDCRGCIAVITNIPFITVVDSTTGSTHKDFHAGYLLHWSVLAAMKSSKCKMFLCGDEYKKPTKFCDPYVLISGATPGDVDRAVDIIKAEISKHKRLCSCT